MKYWEEQGKYQKELDLVSNMKQDMEPEIFNGVQSLKLLNLLGYYTYDMYNNGLCNFADCYVGEIEDMVNILDEIKTSKTTNEHLSTLNELITEVREHNNFSDYVEEVYETCSECEGSGVDEDGETCQECNGHGEVEDEYSCEMSDSEEHQVMIASIMDKLIADEDGVTSLCDDIAYHIINDKEVIKLLEEKKEEVC